MSVKNSKSGKIKAVEKSAASRTTTAKTALVKTAARQTPDAVDEAGLLADLRGLIAAAHRRVATVANATHTMLCWHVGRRLLKENLLEGRAAYGKQILVTVSRELTHEYGKGFSYVEMCRIDRWDVRTLRKKIGSMLFQRTALSKNSQASISSEITSRFPPDRKRTHMTTRRKTIFVLGAGTLTAMLALELLGGTAAHAQGSGPPARIGFIWPNSAAESANWLAAFKQGMRDNGLIEGQHYVLDAVYADGQSERFPALAQELLQRAPAVIMVATTAAVRAAQQATRTVPIVMIGVSDPVGNGLVASLARPGGNTTGQSSQNEDIAAKFVEFVREALPRAKRMALLTNPGNASIQKLVEQVRVAGLKLGIETRAFDVATPAALDAAFAAITKEQADALVVLSDAMLNAESQRISAFALKGRIAAFASDARFADAGSLLSYGPSRVDMYRRSATYVKKILAGTKPADLPVEQPVKFDMVLNLKTAKALGIKIPPALLIQAERVIE